ncbi:hypothetical protein TWF718_005757 [Orbilia javanica]|uniref:Uncharacterized protein n=1 Tax=Orbilia javanica TaxID=47235 RepID=A0AAN8RP54_9PEZI
MMIGFVKPALVVIAALNFFASATAAPTPEPELEPIDYVGLIETAPGLPTPKELGLTNADLTKPAPELGELMARDILNKRAQCATSTKPNCGYFEALACYNYLNSLTGTRCVVNSAPALTRFCYSGSCAWYGQSGIWGQPASSPCVNVAAGGAWVLNSCYVNGRVAGDSTATGNGNVIIYIERLK